MDTQIQKPFFAYTSQTLPPAQLWIGNPDHLVELVQLFAQKLLCPHNSCQTCPVCLQIRDRQHHALMWFYPDKTYLIEQLDDLFATIVFQLQKDDSFLFILQKADFLSLACANKLLKSIEEPPRGYHFIFLAERLEDIVPTIKSRCITHVISEKSSSMQEHPLVTCFTTHWLSTIEFSKTVDSFSINERESRELLDKILEYWTKEYTEECTVADKKSFKSYSIIKLLQKAYTQLPMPGSSLIFWHNLYLSIARISS